MKKIIITHADRDGLASAAVWLATNPDIDQVFTIRDPRDVAAVLRTVPREPLSIHLFDLPYTHTAGRALEEHFQLGSHILWVDHHLPAWEHPRPNITAGDPPRRRVVLPSVERTTAVRMVIELLHLRGNLPNAPYCWLTVGNCPSLNDVPLEMFAYLKEVCGIGEQTERVYLLDAIEGLVNKKQTPDPDSLKSMLEHSFAGVDTLTDAELELASQIRNRFTEVERFFSTPNSNPAIWNISDRVVYVHHADFGPLRGIPRKYISMIAQRTTRADVAVIRHRQNWAYVGARFGTNINLMDVMRQIPGLNEGEGMKGHSYVVSMKGFSIVDASEPVEVIADYIRRQMRGE